MINKTSNNKSKTLTIFTPTYNRAHTIIRTYESLCRQTCKGFDWLVIDDGSSDDTAQLIKGWQKLDCGFKISYVWKENGGLHTGYNKAIEIMETELCVCIDSDDYMSDDAVENILNCWNNNKSKTVAGIIGLNFYPNNTPIGGWFPQIKRCHEYELHFKYKHRGDIKFVVRVDLFKEVYPQPTFNGERNFNPSFMIYKIDYKYEWLILNKNICYVNYQTDGMSHNIFKQYYNSPNSFAAIRINRLGVPKAPVLHYIMQYIHLGSSCRLCKDYSWLKKAPHPFLAYFFLPIGFILSFYVKYKALK